MKLNQFKGNRGFTLIEIVAILAFIAIMLALVLPPFFEKIQIDEALPPNTEVMPVPKFVENHLGHNWVFAKGSTNFSTVIYYPKGRLTVENVSVYPDNTFGPAIFFKYGASYFIDNGGWGKVRGFILFNTPLLDPNPIFIGVSEDRLKEFKAGISSGK